MIVVNCYQVTLSIDKVTVPFSDQKGGETMDTGQRIKALRKGKKMTQDELAKAVGTSKQNISKYERGVVENIPICKLRKLADVLETSAAELIS